MGLQDRRNKRAILDHLAKRATTAQFTPETRKFSRVALAQMVQKYPILYLKPNQGYQGIGVLRITRDGNGFIVESKSKSRMATFDSLWNYLSSWTARNGFLLQQGIDSVTRNRRPFDVRIHMLKGNNEWMVGGIVGRVGPAGGVTAGIIGGGKAVPLSTLIRSHLVCPPESHERIQRQLNQAGRAAANEVGRLMPTDFEFAVDAGIDSRGRVWIFEVNYVRLNLNPFLLGDPAAYRRIVAYRRTFRKKFPQRHRPRTYNKKALKRMLSKYR
ncbi:YheC/YheD family protein [Marininema halotolerans]|uniref:YheC/D like ATP-grasp n=1 Tax=Marininema halotolerans TaxID=1155944 RepID=A0A1I6PUZ8_9BACL|nr:YheC/YheD family protein [Marininema halotolerans]SFS43898.1 YheC/D like ATP-grasp [Marininema halotolerans]